MDAPLPVLRWIELSARLDERLADRRARRPERSAASKRGAQQRRFKASSDRLMREMVEF